MRSEIKQQVTSSWSFILQQLLVLCKLRRSSYFQIAAVILSSVMPQYILAVFALCPVRKNRYCVVVVVVDGEGK